MSKLSLVTIAIVLIPLLSCNSHPDEQEIQDHVTQQLQANKDYTGVKSTVKDGIVTLTGTCVGANCAADIAQNIKGINGVQKVENNITRDNSTDLTMRTSVQSILIKYPGVQADVAAGVIVLRGSIARDSLHSLMTDLGLLHPKKIDNQMVVK